MSSVVELAFGNALLTAGLALLVFAVTRAWRQPVWCHALWVLVLLKLVTPPVGSVSFPVLPWSWTADTSPGHQAGSAVDAAQDARAQAGPLPPLPDDGATDAWAAALRAGVSDGPGAEGPWVGGGASSGAGEPESRETGSGWREPATVAVPVAALVAVWLGGTVLLLLVWGRRIIAVRGLMRMARPAPGELQRKAKMLARRVGLTQCPRVWLLPARISPMLWAGWGRARILFPEELVAGLTPQARETLLLHELAHYRRGDHRIRLLEMLATALYWWHPVVWWARRELHRAEEACCDTWVVSEMPHARKAYATALVQTVGFIAKPHRSIPALASGIGAFDEMKRRVATIMLSTHRKRLSTAGRSALAIAALVFLPWGLTTGRVPESAVSAAGNAATSVQTRSPQEVSEMPSGAGSAALANRTGASDHTETAPSPVRQLPPGMHGAASEETDARPSEAEIERELLALESLGLYAMDLGSGDTAPVANGPLFRHTYFGSPCWSPDGRRILFDASPGRDFQKTHMLLFDPRQGAASRVIDLGPGNCPSWSPDGQQIAFLLNRGALAGAASGIWIMNADGTGRRRLGGYGVPRWSPDGKRLLVFSFSNPPELSLMDVRDGREHPVALDVAAMHSAPNWAGDDQTIVAVVRQDGQVHVALIDVSEPAHARIKEILWTRRQPTDVFPTFPVYSAETGRCLFAGQSRDGSALYAVDSPLDAPVRLEPDRYDTRLLSLAVSPDGQRILFCSDRERRDGTMRLVSHRRIHREVFDRRGS